METNMKVLSKALNDIKNVHGITWQEVTKRSNVHNIGRIVKHDIAVTADSWERLHAAFPDIIPGVEYLDRKGNVLKPVSQDFSDFVFIPKYSTRLSGGGGSLEGSETIEANFAFRKDWVSGHSTNGLALFSVVGDSMAPFICEGDVVLVDLSKNEPDRIVDGKTYAIREGGGVKIKRLVTQGNKLIIRSTDQANYPDYEADEDFCLLGRVVWLGHEVK